MPGKRIYDVALQNTTFTEAVANNAEILTDWGGLVWARPIPISLIGNAWWQGSYDGLVWDDSLKDDHDWAHASTDGGVTWLLFNMSGNADAHPAVTIGNPDGGLSIVANTQVLTLNPATNVDAGSMAATDKAKIDLLKDDYLANIAGGFNIYKDYTDDIDGLTRTHNLRPLVGGVGVTISYVGDTISIAMGGGSGEANTGANVGSLGEGLYDGMNGTILNFRNIHSAGDILTVTLDNALNNIALEIVEANIDHDSLENYVADQHVDHTTVEIATSEGIQGGGDLTATRTLTLAFDELTYETAIEATDTLAFYRTSDDLHYAILYEDLEFKVEQYFNTIYVPLTTQVLTQTGLVGGGALSSDVSIGLGFNNLPTVAFDPVTDYIAIYDASNGNHAKVLVGSVTSVDISAGDGMDFADITGTGDIVLGTPSTLTEATTNQATGTTHTHVVDLSTWELSDLGDVTDTPVSGEYLKWNGSAWVTADPTVGAATPGLPDTSIQFNDGGVFAGNAGLTYTLATNSINLYDAGKLSALLMGNGVASLYHQTNTLYLENVSGSSADLILLNSARFGIGQTSMDAESFLQIQDPDGTVFDNVLVIKDAASLDILKLTQTGNLYLPSIDSATTLDMLYFDTVTGKITYGAKPTTAGGVQTLTANSTSGMLVNGGSTSSATSIRVDQDDNKLTTATIALSDYIGFWDVTASGTYKQRKTTLANFPGWNLNLNGVLQEQIKFNDTLNFVAGTDIQLLYSTTTNELTVNYTGGANPPIEDIAFDFNDVTGAAQTYILDIKASYNYVILSCVLQSDNTVDDVAVKINSTSVTDLSAIDVTTAISDTNATALNNVVAGNQVTLNLGTSSATLIRGKLRVQRT